MKKICLVSPSHPASNPRLVRDATALADAGYEVFAVMPRFDPRWAALENQVLDHARWRYLPVDFLSGRNARMRWCWARLRRRISFRLAKVLPMPGLVGSAMPYGYSELRIASQNVRADLYIAHQHPALPIAGIVAERLNRPLGFDAEDLLAECSKEPVRLVEQIERRYLPRCSYVSTMSSAAGEHLRSKHDLAESPLVLHNAPSLRERNGIQSPGERKRNSVPSIYWFGQTIGPHSRADQVIRAMPLIRESFKLSLRGHPISEYAESLRTLARSLGCEDRLELLPVAGPEEMVRLAADHELMLGSQPGQEPFNQKAIGNKVMVGMMAGLALVLTDTVAHRSLLEEAQGTGVLFADENERDLARALEPSIAKQSIRLAMQENSWAVAGAKLNWEAESQKLISKVGEILS